MKLCGFDAGLDFPFFLIAGTCVIESEQLTIETAGQLQEICARLDIPFIYKSSFDKANRSSGTSFRGPGIDEGLRILAEVKRQLGVPVLTDVHEDTDMQQVADVVDVLQTPAFLCRQTNFIKRVAGAGKPVNIKKGQFLSPWEMKNVTDKAKSTGNTDIMVCERVRPLVITTWFQTCARWLLCGIPVARSCSTQLIPCSYPAARGLPQEASGSLSRCWRAQRLPWGFPACSWRHTLIPTRRSVMAPTPGRWDRSNPCWSRSWNLMR